MPNSKAQEKNVISQSYLAKGNSAMRAGHYSEALNLFEKAQEQNPTLTKILSFNIALVKARLKNNTPRDLTLKEQKPSSPKIIQQKKGKLPVTALVITWDIGHNPLGRSYMLAEALDRVVQNVILTGFQFDRYGNAIWEPVREGRLPVISLKGALFPELCLTLEETIEKFKPDIVFACKPRLPSMQLGAMFKARYGIPLVVDIDDHELSFIKDRSNLTVDSLLKINKEHIRNEVEPYSELWTRLANDLVKYADAKIVSNIALQRVFGGEIIPHVRDEDIFDASLYDKTKYRAKYGIPENAKVVMFFGTPRQHKGIDVIAQAVGKIKDQNFILVVVGRAPDRSITHKLEELSKGKLINLPNQPFSAIPEIIAMADVICLPQDETHETSKYQLPAKAIDAVAMGIPLLVSKTEPLMQLVDDNVAKLVNTKNLHHILEDQVNSIRNENDSEHRRQTFLTKYSYAAAGIQLRAIIDKLVNKKTNLRSCADLPKLIEFQKRSFDVKERPIKRYGKDVVVFWKQNDTTLYGRRHDMIVKYLASRDDVRKVIVIDAPISEFDLVQKRNGNLLTQDRNIYTKTYEKLLGQLDTPKISYYVFTHKPGIYTYKEYEVNKKPIFQGYSAYLQNIFNAENVKPEHSIFWFYPKNFLSTDIIKLFKPGKIVVDVVDDHRAWPGISEEEKNKLTNHYKEILSKADFSLANCQPVINSMAEFSPNIQLVPNGCEETPEIIEPLNNSLYTELKNFKGKVIGFIGNLEAKIDIPLIEKLATSFPDALIVLAGSTHANPAARELAKISNIRMFGVVEYKYANAIASKFSVGIVPHKKMALTENMNPLKIFMYLSNRIPVVTTDVSNIPESNAIFSCSNHEDFISKCRSILSGNLLAYGFDEFIRKNSWKERLSLHVDNLFIEKRSQQQ